MDWKYEINFFDKKQTDTNATQLVFLVSLEPDHHIKKSKQNYISNEILNLP